MGRSGLPKTTSAPHNLSCPTVPVGGGAGCHGPWAILEALPSFWSQLILATFSPPPSQGSTWIIRLPVAKHFQSVK